MAIADSGTMLDVAKLPPDLALMRIENDNIQAMAVARPRDLAAVKKDLLGQLATFPALAEQLIYERPVGKDPETGEETFARNLSVRAAEMLAEAYGFNRVAAKTTLVDDDHAQVEATFVDYQRGRIWTESRPVSRSYKKRGGGTGFHPTDRFLNVVCQAERSKAIREAILRCVPPGLKQELFEAADKQMAKMLTDDQIKNIVKSFAAKGVSFEQIVAVVGRPPSKGWAVADRLKLAGLWRAIEDGEATVEEVFGSAKQAGAAQQPAAGGNAAGSPQNGRGKQPAAAASSEVTADDLANPKGRAEQPLEETPPPNPKGQVGPQKPPQEPAGETTLEREPGDDNDDDAGYETQAEGVEELPEWAQSLYDELQAEGLGIREIKALAKRYADAPERTNTDRDWIKSVSDQACEAVRNSRGAKSNSPQQREFEQN